MTSKRILVADDDPFWIDTVSKALGAEGHNVVTASDPWNAENLLWGKDADAFDLVVSDNKMSSADPAWDAGIDLRHGMLLQSEALENTPFILYTSEVSQTVLEKAKKYQFIALKKNRASQAELLAYARTLLQTKRPPLL